MSGRSLVPLCETLGQGLCRSESHGEMEAEALHAHGNSAYLLFGQRPHVGVAGSAVRWVEVGRGRGFCAFDGSISEWAPSFAGEGGDCPVRDILTKVISNRIPSCVVVTTG